MAKKPGTEDETSAGSQLQRSIVANIATRVREARENAKLKQSDLAALVGTSQSSIYLVEAADANITIKTLVKIAEALQVNPVGLLMDKETLAILNRSKVAELSNITQRTFQELQTVMISLSGISDMFQQMCKLLEDQSKILDAVPPSQD